MRLKSFFSILAGAALIFSALPPQRFAARPKSTRWGQKPMFPMIWWKVSPIR